MVSKVLHEVLDGVFNARFQIKFKKR